MSFASTWRHPADAWRWACNTILSRGDLVKTEDNQLTREVLNLMVTVLEPHSGWPIPGSNWVMAGLKKYAEQLLSPKNPTGFAYTYGGRLFAYPNSFDELRKQDNHGLFDDFTNQIAEIIDRLKRSNSTRRAVAPVWIPWFDHFNNSEVPCLQIVDFLYRQDALHLTAYFRSQDVSRAWPANLYGLSKLLSYVGEQAGMVPGSITTISASAHIYER